MLLPFWNCVFKMLLCNSSIFWTINKPSPSLAGRLFSNEPSLLKLFIHCTRSCAKGSPVFWMVKINSCASTVIAACTEPASGVLFNAFSTRFHKFQTPTGWQKAGLHITNRLPQGGQEVGTSAASIYVASVPAEITRVHSKLSSIIR